VKTGGILFNFLLGFLAWPEQRGEVFALVSSILVAYQDIEKTCLRSFPVNRCVELGAKCDSCLQEYPERQMGLLYRKRCCFVSFRFDKAPRLAMP
jgi:hypothetical protein